MLASDWMQNAEESFSCVLRKHHSMLFRLLHLAGAVISNFSVARNMLFG